ncbi:regulator of nucleoside diphosphate kinase [Chitinophaga rupis]|uniref:Regulator of nucleoside diphosphate kinase n=1 Tax=Chitinophaga rupis TaxID=573321 RepID=A0A1H8GQL1_9BACT|nr:GreA/GreB family elongation factor [Chitinophaga rupis]SEN46266.1 regulator of nucleoside diphosphate kinase [Chitinophaga rupis]
MQKIKEQLVLTKYDYEVILSNLKNGLVQATFNKQDAEELGAELKKAKLVDDEDMPPDVVRLNSSVTVKEERENKVLKITIVMPEKADIKQKKVSIMSPIGTALIGYKKGSKVSWKVPAGRRTFTILEVSNPINA